MTEPPPADPPAVSPGEEARTAAGRRPRGRWRRRLLVLALLTLAAAGAGTAAVAYAYSQVRVLSPDQVRLPQATLLYYADGRTEFSRRGTDRTSVPLQQVPEHVQQAVLAAEDRRFYTEPGVSPRGIARAAWANVRGGEVSQGGSTITQQYARAQYLSQERTFRRKATEILVAVKLSRTFAKDDVLEAYLNTVYFGRQAYGVDAAARAYFGVPVQQLTPEQGALLAGVIRAPSAYDPRTSPDQAERVFRSVLTAMRTEGWYAGDPATVPVPPTRGDRSRPADVLYLEQQVQRELRALGLEPDLPGLQITTTLSKRAQDTARREVAELFKDVPLDVRTALVSVEPGTGAVRASYGGRVYGEEQALDAVWQERRQPGSVFKAVTLTTALQRGISLRSQYDGRDDLVLPGYPEGVSNFGDRDHPRLDLIKATAKSVNSIYVALGIDAGLERVVDTAHALGVPEETELKPVPSLSLGTEFVRPVDMATVFATLAEGGVRADPYLVEKVVLDGRVLHQHEKQSRRVVHQKVAGDAAYALGAVMIPGGTAKDAALGRPAFGKTGTTSDNTAAWFVGATPALSTAVAIFGPKPADRLRIDGLREVTGGSLPAQLWRAYNVVALDGVPPEPLPKVAFAGTARGTPTPSPSPSPSPSASASPTGLRVATVAPAPTSAAPGAPGPPPPAPQPEPPAPQPPATAQPPTTQAPTTQAPAPSPTATATTAPATAEPTPTRSCKRNGKDCG